jgi:NAD(P)-dependent dehydrogenase (short-subunit alcohol dehydrogenase family)
MELDGASAIVTGGASGLGRATARALIDGGASVVLVDLPGPRGDEAAAELGGRARFVAADVANEAEVQAAIDVASAIAPLRVAVNCAGIVTANRTVGRDGPAPLDAFERTIRVNLIGTFNVTRQIGQAAYSASKAAVAGMTLPIARDLSKLLIRVVTIAPGIFETPMMAGMSEDVRTSLEAQVPHPSRLGHPTEYAALVRSIIANPMLNGETIRLDGAIRMQPR